MGNYYPESKVETKGFMARHYDTILDLATLWRYSLMIKKCIKLIGIKPTDKILDLGTGTGKNAYLMLQYLLRKGKLIGVDISWEMISQFKKRCAEFPNAKIINARVDKSLPFREKFDKVFICFVLHGFPQVVREIIIKNAFNLLKNSGRFLILDYNEFSIPFYLKIPFTLFECPYMFDFIKRDWKKILANYGFSHFEEHFLFGKYVRLIKVMKN
ncbi:class I SAM-dependent methyltransferase [candidate division WOR-3 bacterium]|nr:class I SAM-dependent methyltransferase [candidate division WOR-3 bacterium]